jgi:predicted NAD-dependent protein-ADP-ribosyltransferase YbiA (DUF1768 family)
MKTYSIQYKNQNNRLMAEKKILENRVINFFSGKKEYRSLSNFWEKEIIMKQERIYESGEHCFHGEKYIRLGEECQDESRKQVLLEYGKTFLKPSQYKTCSVAKKAGGKKGLLLSEIELREWATVGIQVQRDICLWKFENFVEVRNDLVKSRNNILIHPAMRCSEEKVKERTWEGKAIIRDGEVVVLGKNMLGNIWMDLRD